MFIRVQRSKLLSETSKYSLKGFIALGIHLKADRTKATKRFHVYDINLFLFVTVPSGRKARVLVPGKPLCFRQGQGPAQLCTNGCSTQVGCGLISKH
jgi:hypothetical protein